MVHTPLAGVCRATENSIVDFKRLFIRFDNLKSGSSGTCDAPSKSDGDSDSTTT